MTVLMDKFFTNIGLDEAELKSSTLRSYLYIGIIFMLGMSTAFLAAAVMS